jgi:hypothetical protein
MLNLLRTDRELALGLKQVGAALRADELLGKAIGLFIERSEVGKPGNFEGISDRGEIIQAILERLGVHSGGNGPSEVDGSERGSREQPDIVR